MKSPLNFIFMGTPDVAVESLEKLSESGYLPTLIVTAPDRPVGRGLVMTPSPVKVWAEGRGITTLTPEKVDADFLLSLTPYVFDLALVVAYGKILPENLISLPKYGTLNIHYSLLPRFRGASPVESTILSGDTETGVTIQSMVYALDAGDILAVKKTPVHPDETSPELRARLSTLGADLLIDTLDHLDDRLAHKQPQDGDGITKCGKIKKTDGEVRPDDDAEDLYRKFRAYQPWPGIYYFDEHNKRIKITEMKRVNGIPKIIKIIPEGGKEISLL